MRTIIAATTLAVLLLAAPGCSDDPEQPNIPPQNPYRALQARDDILFNLGLAYNKLNFDEVTKLLDDNFVFHFSTSDVQNGIVLMSQWDRASELAATANMFNPNTPPPGRDPVSNISLELFYNDGMDEWEEIAPSDTLQYPGEKWYRQQIDYRLRVDAGETTYTQYLPFKTEFIIRPVDDNGTTIWRIVSWSDQAVTAALRDGTAAATSTQSSSWGGIKFLYYGE